MTGWLWLLLPFVAFALTRFANTRWIVPAWRADRLASGPAALAVAGMRGLTVASAVAAIVLAANAPLVLTSCRRSPGPMTEPGRGCAGRFHSRLLP